MMSSMEERMTALEEDVAQIREEWVTVAQAPLIQARLLNSLRETQLEHSTMLNQHGKVLSQHTEVLNQHTADLSQLKGDVTELKLGQYAIAQMLTTLIERDDRG